MKTRIFGTIFLLVILAVLYVMFGQDDNHSSGSAPVQSQGLQLN